MQPINIAIVRGDSLKKQETQVFEQFDKEKFNITARCGLKNIPSLEGVSLPVKRLRSSADTFVGKNFYKYLFGRYNMLFGLENELRAYDIAHTVELYNYYKLQAVRAKRLNTKLKVVTTVVDNTFGRFEYNYWPGFKMPPLYWRRQLKKIMDYNKAEVDKFLPVSHDAAGLLLDYGVPEKKIQVVIPGIVPAPVVDRTLFPPELAGKEAYLMVNRLVKEKGVYDVLYGWRIYLSKLLDSSTNLLVIVGKGPELQNMVRIVKERGLSDKVIFNS